MILKYFLPTCLIALVFSTASAGGDDGYTEYDKKIIFTVYKGDNTSFVWELGTKLTTQGCAADGKFAVIVHGFLNSISLWGKPMADQLLKHRGGCVMYMNWGEYSDSIDYVGIVFIKFQKIVAALVKRLKQLEDEGVSTDDMFMVGHSLGARLVLLAGESMGGRLPYIDALDPAGPGFFIDATFSDAKKAAQNVQCVHTSADLGTTIYNCHQNWLMGSCGITQCAAKPITFLASYVGFIEQVVDVDTAHNLANAIYLKAFDHEFLADNCYKCPGVTAASELPAGFRMGYMESRRNPSIIAKIASSTSSSPPFNGNDCCPATIFNTLKDLVARNVLFQ